MSLRERSVDWASWCIVLILLLASITIIITDLSVKTMIMNYDRNYDTSTNHPKVTRRRRHRPQPVLDKTTRLAKVYLGVGVLHVGLDGLDA